MGIPGFGCFLVGFISSAFATGAVLSWLWKRECEENETLWHRLENAYRIIDRLVQERDELKHVIGSQALSHSAPWN